MMKPTFIAGDLCFSNDVIALYGTLNLYDFKICGTVGHGEIAMCLSVSVRFNKSERFPARGQRSALGDEYSEYVVVLSPHGEIGYAYVNFLKKIER